MNTNYTLYLYALFFIYFSEAVFGQQLTLKIVGKDSIQTSFLNTILYESKHPTEKKLYNEIYTFHEQVKQKGYLTSTFRIDSDHINSYLAIFDLGKRTHEIVVLIPSDFKMEVPLMGKVAQDSIKIKTESFEDFTNLLVQALDKQGKSFSSISYTNPVIKEELLYVQLQIVLSKTRSIDDIIIRGYDQFPRSFTKNFFQIHKNTTFSKQELSRISKLTKTLSFAQEKKAPEVLFKKDSTILYLFLDKLEANSVDGIINFGSKDNGNGLLVNGTIDLKLNNILNTGENFELFWNQIANERSEFKLTTRLPYLFNSPISPEMRISIYRQDSTFLNTRFRLDLDYQLNPKSSISTFYSTENSNNLVPENLSPQLLSYSNHFFGVGYNFQIASSSSFYPHWAEIIIKSGYGNRRSDAKKTSQFKIDVSSIFKLKLSNRAYIYLKNETGFLNSKNLLTNEAYRIGGINSIRGFNEQSIFTSKYSFLNLEYRFQTSQTSYLYSITDLGFYERLQNRQIERLIGLGAGYSFNLKNNQVTLGYAVGLNTNISKLSEGSKLMISWKSLF